jgi:GNAT superfamily N-acetyltransferase
MNSVNGEPSMSGQNIEDATFRDTEVRAQDGLDSDVTRWETASNSDQNVARPQPNIASAEAQQQLRQQAAREIISSAGVTEHQRIDITDEQGKEALDSLSRSRGHAPGEVVSTVLEFLASKPVGYAEESNEEEGGNILNFVLGGIGVANVNFFTDESGKADVGMITVNEQLRRHGLGTRLMHAAIALIKERGITELDSGNLSGDGLRTRIAVFGGDNLSFYFDEKHRSEGREGAPPANAQEALTLLDHLEASKSPEDSSVLYTFGVHTDLTTIDTEQWEHPVPAKITAEGVLYT